MEIFIHDENTAYTEDALLSWKAKGMLSYILEHTELADVEELQKASRDQRTAVYSGLKELEDKGYICRIDKRNDAQQYEFYYLNVRGYVPPLEVFYEMETEKLIEYGKHLVNYFYSIELADYTVQDSYTGHDRVLRNQRYNIAPIINLIHSRGVILEEWVIKQGILADKVLNRLKQPRLVLTLEEKGDIKATLEKYVEVMHKFVYNGN